MIKDQEFRDPLLALQQIRKTHPNPENLAVTFTQIDKVGLNPQSRYDTPLGIYLYPLDYVIEKQMNVPYAGNEPYLNVCEFTRPEKILQMTSDVSNQKGEQLLNVFSKKEVDEVNLKYREGLGIEYHLRSNYSKLWLVTRILANNKPTQWNINFRKCGIDGFVDHGTGTIHPSEPTQCVVFAANNLKLLHSINNPAFDKITDKFGVDTYKRKTFNYDGNKMSDEQIIGVLQSRKILDIKNLLDYATDADKIAKLIINNKPELSTFDVENLLHNVTDKDKTAELIISKKSNLYSVVKKLITYAKDKDKIAKLIIEKKTELTDTNVLDLLHNVTNKDKIAELIIKYKTELTYENVSGLIRYATDKEKDKIAELIIKKQPELFNRSVSELLRYATDKEKIAGLLGTDNINKLTDNDVGNLLSSTDEEKMAKILGEKNINKLSDIGVYSLLASTTDKEKMAKALGEKNINKLSDYHVYNLINDVPDKHKPEVAQFVNKYHTNKTPEIQELIDKYLKPQTIAAK